MTAVAIGYATLGAPSSSEWNASLGLESEDNSKSVFGSICQMLVYNLEYEQDVTNTNRLDTVITPLRRNAAAQVVEILAMEFASAWYDQVSSVAIRNEQGFQQHDFQPIDNVQDQVAFVTDDQQQVVGCRPLLRAVSPIFRALLSSEYVESDMSLIPLHDVTYHSLKDLVKIINQVNEDSKMALLSPDRVLANTSWPHVVAILQISDRFGCTIVKALCENWVVNNIKEMEAKSSDERMVCLEGMVWLYRQCRDPIERDGGISSDTWPFSTILKESLKTIVQYLTEACQTPEFMKMVQDKNADELEAFCDGIAKLIKKSK
ncbi:hypothetical protein RMCBS344292_14472 [Rhizopus microsporus]|nr:hypothetical protein RMCBS344292_14472 [Rhizopus microsporus]